MNDPYQGGLYRPRDEHDACGVGFVAEQHGHRSRRVIETALSALCHLSHRGATGADPLTSDGAGILCQIPHEFFAAILPVPLPAAGEYGVGMLFLPRESAARRQLVLDIEADLAVEGLQIIAWREVPTELNSLGPVGRASCPAIWQVFVSSSLRDGCSLRDLALERQLYVARRVIERRRPGFYVCSLSARTICYKGLLLPEYLASFYPDLASPTFISALAVVHERFSTNTAPSWERAHPYRAIAHNGEINTLQGNIAWMHSREAALASPFFPDMAKLLPIHDPDGSDSSIFDDNVQLLLHAGRSIEHTMAMMMPEAWEQADIAPDRRAFYAYHAALMEPWDGPAAIVFTDGKKVGAMLDRNGLRPARYVVTRDGLVVLASEFGVLAVSDEEVVAKDRLRPSEMLLVDTEHGTFQLDAEIKTSLAAHAHYAEWVARESIPLEQRAPLGQRPADLAQHERMLAGFGYSREDLRLVLQPMAEGAEAVGSMGNDTPLAVLSRQPALLYNYFRQRFAQVTNPPIDPLRETSVMSLSMALGPEQNLLAEIPEHARKLVLSSPLLSEGDLAELRTIARPGFAAITLDLTFPATDTLEAALGELQKRAAAAALGHSLLILSDRALTADRLAIPALLGLAAVHRGLIAASLRDRCSLLLETGEAREVMHFALLIGYGAGAIHPYLALQAVAELNPHQAKQAAAKYLAAGNKGLLKVIAKMGISTLQSYRGAQMFEALGLAQGLVDRFFSGTPTPLGGHDLVDLERALRERSHRSELTTGGFYQWRADEEHHAYNPRSIAELQHATRSGSYERFKRYAQRVYEEDVKGKTLRGLLEFVPSAAPVPLAEVESVASIVCHFKTGAMSYGSISKEAHETLAIAMNRLGGKSNTGEGGEAAERFAAMANGDSKRSAIKQVASARFGVTMNYLVNADELQIKVAQGAKPGEGGQLPGYKVDETIAALRCSTPGVGLISPPPHHDIYSIEDLAQLIGDLRAANNHAAVSVKLVAEAGVGTVAAGVAKAKADLIVISGDSGGTGAAPLSSIKYAGVPWELGLAEAQQVLVQNRLRSRVRLETDGQLKTGRDVAVACLLGAEEFAFSTAPLVALGCVMMRVCHLNTCPVGIATQDPSLRARFTGEPEHVINFMVFVASELREIMAELGFRQLSEMVGRVDRLRPLVGVSLDLSRLLYQPTGDALHCTSGPTAAVDSELERGVIADCEPALARGEPVVLERAIKNLHRAFATPLSREVTRRFGEQGLPAGTIQLKLHGHAGQSFAAFLAHGIHIELVGDANDYVGKGLCGGQIVIRPPRGIAIPAEDMTVAGNVALYGATAGELFVRGRVGERFAVRNSGATAIVEGLGDHGCEYMTRGAVVVLGAIGRNFAAGMTGGSAFVYDGLGNAAEHINSSTVAVEAPSGDDLVWLRELLRRHFELTESAVAWRILSSFTEQASKFLRLIPNDYRAHLERGSVSRAVQHG